MSLAVRGMTRTIRPAELVRRTQQSLAALYEGTGGDGLTLPQFSLLDALKRHGPQTGLALIGLTGIDRSTLYGMVERLRDGALLAAVRIESEKQGPRPICISLTPKGRRALEKAETRLWNAEVKLMASLKPKERSALLDALSVTAFAGPRP